MKYCELSGLKEHKAYYLTIPKSPKWVSLGSIKVLVGLRSYLEALEENLFP